MLEIYPVAVLNASQLQNMLEQWKRNKVYLKSTTSPSAGILAHVMTNRFFKEVVPRTVHDLVYELAHRHLRASNMKFTYQINQVQRLRQPWARSQHKYDLVFLIHLSGATPPHGHVSFPCFPELQHALKAGRLLMISRDCLCYEMPNCASTPRTSLMIGVRQ